MCHIMFIIWLSSCCDDNNILQTTAVFSIGCFVKKASFQCFGFVQIVTHSNIPSLFLLCEIIVRNKPNI